MTDTVTIATRFCGPPTGGNGGYACGLVAAPLGAGAVEVTLFLPPPLEVELDRELADEPGGEVARLLDGDELIAEGRRSSLDLPLPALPSLDQAHDARARYPWREGHPWPSCFVCGTGRTPGDGLCLDPGPVDPADGTGRGVHATVWVPAADLADDRGEVRSEFVWSALDCPTGAPVLSRDGVGPSVLGRLVAEQLAPVVAGRPYLVACWALGSEGRKHRGAAVLVDPTTGALVGRSQGTWIELRVS
jgi:hypothetical protein